MNKYIYSFFGFSWHRERSLSRYLARVQMLVQVALAPEKSKEKRNLLQYLALVQLLVQVVAQAPAKSK